MQISHADFTYNIGVLTHIHVVREYNYCLSIKFYKVKIEKGEVWVDPTPLPEGTAVEPARHGWAGTGIFAGNRDSLRPQLGYTVAAERDADVLGFHVELEAVVTAVAPDAAGFHAAKGGW